MSRFLFAIMDTPGTGGSEASRHAARTDPAPSPAPWASRGRGPGGALPVNINDMLGEIKFNALAATNAVRTGVSIRSFITGVPDADHLPANLIFQTGTANLIDRMAITADGLVGIGTITPGFNLDVVGNTHTSGDFYGRIHMDLNPGNPGPDTVVGVGGADGGRERDETGGDGQGAQGATDHGLGSG